MWSKSIEMFNPYEATIESIKTRGGVKHMKFRVPFTGDQRVVKRFAWYPLKIAGFVYWLEWLTIRQSYDTRHPGWNNDCVISKYK